MNYESANGCIQKYSTILELSWIGISTDYWYIGLNSVTEISKSWESLSDLSLEFEL